MSDSDGSQVTAADRALLYAVWSGGAWQTAAVLPGGPAGPLSPDIALDSGGRALVVFAAPPAGAGTSAGSTMELWSAYQREAGWEVARIGAGLRGERPQVAVDGANRALAVFRRFGLANVQGVVSVATADLTAPALVWSEAGALDAPDGLNWQVAFDVDATTGAIFPLYVHNPRQSPAPAANRHLRSAGPSIACRWAPPPT